MERITNFSSKLWQSDKFLIGLGGDHGVTFPIVKALVETTGKKVGIIHMDAHYDNMPHYNGDKFARCTHLQDCMNEPMIPSIWSVLIRMS